MHGGRRVHGGGGLNGKMNICERHASENNRGVKHGKGVHGREMYGKGK